MDYAMNYSGFHAAYPLPTYCISSPAQPTMEALIKSEIKKPQVQIPVVHRFAPGLYIREATMPRGTFVIGHTHKTECLNVMLKGRMDLMDDEVGMKRLEAPQTFVSKPGRKAAFIREETVWLNIWATDETDIEKLEEMFLDKPEFWDEHVAAKKLEATPFKQEDRDDFLAFCDEVGLTHEQVTAISEIETDLIVFPWGDVRVKVGPSVIAGKGILATSTIRAGEVVAPARIGGARTPAGRFANHSKNPNAKFVRCPNGDLNLVATRHICGGRGGLDGEEVTIDYRQAMQVNTELKSCLVR